MLYAAARSGLKEHIQSATLRLPFSRHVLRSGVGGRVSWPMTRFARGGHDTRPLSYDCGNDLAYAALQLPVIRDGVRDSDFASRVRADAAADKLRSVDKQPC